MLKILFFILFKPNYSDLKIVFLPKNRRFFVILGQSLKKHKWTNNTYLFNSLDFVTGIVIKNRGRRFIYYICVGII